MGGGNGGLFEISVHVHNSEKPPNIANIGNFNVSVRKKH